MQLECSSNHILKILFQTSHITGKKNIQLKNVFRHFLTFWWFSSSLSMLSHKRRLKRAQFRLRALGFGRVQVFSTFDSRPLFSHVSFNKSSFSVGCRGSAAGASFCALFPKNTSKPLPCTLIFTTRSLQATFLITLKIWSGDPQKSPRLSHFRSGSNLDQNPPGFGR